MKIHLTAVAGTGMGSFAGLLKAAGHEVRGSDVAFWPPMGDLLRKWEIPLLEGFAAENLDWDPELVVIGNVCRRDNPEAVATLARGIPYSSFAGTLGELFLADRRPLVVAGTHGKSTTSALASWTLHSAGLEPGFLVGAELLNFGGSFATGAARSGAPFVVEGDEYDTAYFDKGPKFLHYRPWTAILTSVELDHTDIYMDLTHVAYAFRRFVRLVPAGGRIVACADHPLALEIAQTEARPGAEVVAYSAADAREVEADRSGTMFTLDGERLRLPMWGAHNLSNAVAVARATQAYGLSWDAIREAFADFAGVRRRQELRGEVNGISVIDDFAHHPTAVQVTVDAVRQGFGRSGRVIAVLEPRSAAACRKASEQPFGEALRGADHAIVAANARRAQLSEEEALDPAGVARVAGGEYIAEVPAIVDRIVEIARPGDAVLIMSNGAFGGIHLALLDALQSAAS